MQEIPTAQGVLTWSPDPSAVLGEEFEAVCKHFELTHHIATAADFAAPVGFLIGSPGFDEKKGVFIKQVPPLAAAVFYGLAGESLTAVLGALSAAGVKIPLKAVVTEHNIHWPLGELLVELGAERQAFLDQSKK